MCDVCSPVNRFPKKKGTVLFTGRNWYQCDTSKDPRSERRLEAMNIELSRQESVSRL